jgi:type I restriction enzyme, S subunit
VREGWEEKTLKEVCEHITDGTHQTPTYFDEGVIFLSSRNVKSEKIDWDNIKFIDESQHQEMQKRLSPRKGDILLAKNGTTGVAAMVDRDVTFDIYVSLALLRALPLVDRKYLLHFLNSPCAREQFSKRLKGAGVPNLHLKEIRAVRIPVPPLPEQRRIVAILDEAFEGIAAAKANAEKNLENAREVFEAEMAKIFDGNKSWRSCLIEDVINFIDYRGKTPKKTGSGLRLITAKNVKMGLLKDEPAEYVEPSSYDSWMTRGIPKKGDVLFTTEAPLANVAELDTDEKVVFAQRIIIMQPNPSELFSPFLKYMLMSQPLQKNIHDNGTGATVKGIKSSLLKKIKLSFPKGLKQQKEISKRLELIEQSVGSIGKLVAQKLNTLDELKKSLLHQAFNGDL